MSNGNHLSIYASLAVMIEEEGLFRIATALHGVRLRSGKLLEYTVEASETLQEH